MPFGLRNAPATFQQLRYRFRSGLPGVTLLAYLDDVIVLSASFEQHIKDLQLVFDRLREYSLRLNRAKCFFARPEVHHFGHVITPSGLKTNPDKVQAILEREPPKNLKQLQSFLQTGSWYRRYISHFAEISKPLSRLTKKNVQWKWSQDEQQAFNELQRLLTTAHILQQADPSKSYTLRTDASQYALGAALLQGEGPEERPIEFASRLLTPAEMNYSTTEREALALVWSVKKLEDT